jgi:hypothetical protein
LSTIKIGRQSARYSSPISVSRTPVIAAIDV